MYFFFSPCLLLRVHCLHLDRRTRQLPFDGCSGQCQLNAPQPPPQLLDHLSLPSHLLIYFVSYIYVCSGGRDRFAKGSVPLWDFPSSDFLGFTFCLRKPPSSFFCFFFSFLLMYSILFFFWPTPHLFATPHRTHSECDFVWFSFYLLLRTIFFFPSVSVVISLPRSLCPVSYYMHYSTRVARIFRLVLVFPVMPCPFYFFPWFLFFLTGS